MFRKLLDDFFFQTQFKITVAKSYIWEALEKPEIHLKDIPHKSLSSLLNAFAADAMKATKETTANINGNFNVELNNQCIYRAQYLMDAIQGTHTQTPTPEMKAIVEKYYLKINK